MRGRASKQEKYHRQNGCNCRSVLLVMRKLVELPSEYFHYFFKEEGRLYEGEKVTG